MLKFINASRKMYATPAMIKKSAAVTTPPGTNHAPSPNMIKKGTESSCVRITVSILPYLSASTGPINWATAIANPPMAKTQEMGGSGMP